MELLDSSGTCFTLDDDLLNFKLDGEGEEEEGQTISDGASASSPVKTSNSAAALAPFCRGAFNAPFPEFVEEEELEWLSNKDAFPALDTCFGILADNPELVMNHQSPVSVLENSNSNSSTSSNSNSNSNSNALSFPSICNSLKVPNHPVRARSKRRRRRAGFGNLPSQQSLWVNQVNVKIRKEEPFSMPPLTTGVAGMGRRCLHCQAEKTPQWRAGPMGPKTLCNACGVRYKSGRLLPEYRPASSPTFSNELHSNSHRKVVEMRRQKEYICGEGIPVNVACGYRVG